MEDQNRFISLAEDGETRTPSTGTKNNTFVSGLKFSSINVNGISTLQEMCCGFWLSREMWYRKSIDHGRFVTPEGTETLILAFISRTGQSVAR